MDISHDAIRAIGTAAVVSVIFMARAIYSYFEHKKTNHITTAELIDETTEK